MSFANFPNPFNSSADTSFPNPFDAKNETSNSIAQDDSGTRVVNPFDDLGSEAPKIAETSDKETDAKRRSSKDRESGVSQESLPEYPRYSRCIKSIYAASDDEVKDRIVEILACEGPMLGKVLIERYVRCGGDLRVDKNAKSKVNRSIARLLGKGAIQSLNPRNSQGYVKRIFFLEGQNADVLRQSGGRSLEEIPETELIALMKFVQTETGATDPEELMRETLNALDLSRMTTKAREILEFVYSQVNQA